MATKRTTLFDYMKKYQLPKPPWMEKPAWEQNDEDWKSMPGRLYLRRFSTFIRTRTKHELFLYDRLFPQPQDWESREPLETDTPPAKPYHTKGWLQIRPWEPECPDFETPSSPEGCICIEATAEDLLSLQDWHFFSVKMYRDNPYRTECYSLEHLLMMAYLLTLSRTHKFTQLQDSVPGEPLWQEVRKAAWSSRSYGWLKIQPHVLGLGAYRKFTQNPELRQLLLDTGDKPLVYIDPENKLLGGTFKNGSFVGENLYGRILMQVRSELLRVYDNIILCQGDPNKKDEVNLSDFFGSAPF